MCLKLLQESFWHWLPLWRTPSVSGSDQCPGVRENSLIGYGLVVGLDGTGDQTTQTPFTTQTLNNMLSQLGITVPTGTNMQLKNVAAVMVTASYPPLRDRDKRSMSLFPQWGTLKVCVAGRY